MPPLIIIIVVFMKRNSFCASSFVRLLSFSHWTPLQLSAAHGHLEVTRLLVESKADVAARRCFSPPSSHHLSLTIRLAAGAGAALHSPTPKSMTTTLLHTSAASARLNDALPRLLRPSMPTSNRPTILQYKLNNKTLQAGVRDSSAAVLRLSQSSECVYVTHTLSAPCSHSAVLGP